MIAKQLIIILSIFFLYTSCQKEVNKQQEKQGTNFNRLLKTISKNVYGNNYDWITEYTYHETGKLKEVTRTIHEISGNSSMQKDTYYRDLNDRLDSIVYVNITSPQSAPFHNFYKTEFHYNATGNIAYTVNRTKLSTYPTDSTLYFYTGNLLTQRVVYRLPPPPGNNFITITFSYTYDARGNISGINVAWSSQAGSKTCIFTYDNNTNSLPVMEWENELYGNWIKAFDNNFTAPNNLLSRRVSPGFDWDWGSMNYEYIYTPNNKPLRQRIMNADGPGSYEVFYYYD